MPVQFKCTGCPTTLRANDASIGKRTKCPKCGTIVVVPRPTPKATTSVPSEPESELSSFLDQAAEHEGEAPAIPKPAAPAQSAPRQARRVRSAAPEGNPSADRARQWGIRSLKMFGVSAAVFVVLFLCVALFFTPKNLAEAMNAEKIERLKTARTVMIVLTSIPAAVWAVCSLGAFLFGALGLVTAQRSMPENREGVGRSIFGLLVGVLPAAIVAGVIFGVAPALRGNEKPTGGSSGGGTVSAVPAPSNVIENAPLVANHAENLLRQARQLTDATVSGNHNRFVDGLFPKFVEVAGGRQALISRMQTELKQMKSQGAQITGSKVSPPTQIKQSGKYVFAKVPATMTVRTAHGSMSVDASLLAISTDRGATWKFVDNKAAQNPIFLMRVLPEAEGVFDEPAPKAPARRPSASTPKPSASKPSAPKPSAPKSTPTTTHSQTNLQDPQGPLRKQFREYGRARSRADAETAVDFFHPEVLKALGGRDAGIAILQKEFDRQSEDKVEIGKTVSKLVTGQQKIGQRLFVPYIVTRTLRSPEWTRETTSIVTGISDDNGLTWKFLEQSDEFPDDLLKIAFPETSGVIELPKLDVPVSAGG